MKVSAFTVAMVLWVLATPTDSTQNQKSQDPCANAQTTAEMRDCAGKEYKQADAELNKAYKQVMSKLDDEGHQAALKIAQQAWIKHRDTNCEYDFGRTSSEFQRNTGLHPAA